MGFSIPIKVLADEVEKRKDNTPGLKAEDAFKSILRGLGSEGAAILQPANKAEYDRIHIALNQELMDRVTVRARKQHQARTTVKKASLTMGRYFGGNPELPSVRDQQIARERD